MSTKPKRKPARQKRLPANRPARRDATPARNTALEVTPARSSDVAKALQAGLLPTQLAFCLEYLENGFNATKAYLKAHPDVTEGSAAVAGFRTLRSAKVAAYLNERLEQVWSKFHMSGDQALARVAFLIHETEDDKTRLAGLKLVLEQTGKLKTLPQSVDALADALRQDYIRHGKPVPE